MSLKPMQLRRHLLGVSQFVNKKGLNVCMLDSKVTTVGGGTYLSRALSVRNLYQPDVIVFMIPASDKADKTRERIIRGREDLMAAVKPLILPFKITVVINSNQQAVMEYMKDLDWSQVKY